MDDSPPAHALIKFGRFELDVDKGELREAGVLRSLPPQPFRLLVLLTDRAGATVSRAQIRQCLWGDRKYVDAERGINFCLNQIRSALRDPAVRSQYIKTHARRGYRFIAPIDRVAPDTWSVAAAASAPLPLRTLMPSPSADVPPKPKFRPLRGMALVLAALSALALPSAQRTGNSLSSPTLTAKDRVVVAGFANATGETVFDETLTQVLTIELRQSPFLDVLPDAKAQQVLKMMRRDNDSRISPEIGRELCLRTGSVALVGGKLSSLGGHYIVAVNAIACGSGEPLFNAQTEVPRREDVLLALSRSAAQLRADLGESLPSVRKFDVPIEATTTSLEALQRFTIGLKVAESQGDAASIPLLKRAVELDPQFASGYAALATRYNNLAQPSLALEYATKAYELRDRVTEPERLMITSRYLRLRGELEKLTQTLEMWKSEYPRDGFPYGSLGSNYIMMGQYPQALAEWQAALGLRPDDVISYDNLGAILLALERPEDAERMVDAAMARHLDGSGLRWVTYNVGFIKRDTAQMRRQMQWAVGKPGAEDVILSAQADTDAYFGRLRSARELSRQAVDSAQRSNYTEAAALWQAVAALREAEYGDFKGAVAQAVQALHLDAGRNVKIIAALALARSGSLSRANELAKDLEQGESFNTALSVGRLPSIKAAIALRQGRPARAIELLEIVRPYELGKPSPTVLAPLYPIYLRGEAYLALHDTAAAAAEFQNVLDHPGITLNSPLGVLARLELARTYESAADHEKARVAYEDFLTLWKYADADIPIHVAAELEYARLPSERRRLVSAR